MESNYGFLLSECFPLLVILSWILLPEVTGRHGKGGAGTDAFRFQGLNNRTIFKFYSSCPRNLIQPTATKFSNSSKEKVNIYIFIIFFLMLRDIK